jgi:hypothetical protein
MVNLHAEDGRYCGGSRERRGDLRRDPAAYLFLDQSIYAAEEERGRYVACWPPLGLWPQKGTIAVGSDADLVIIDPAARPVVDLADMHSRGPGRFVARDTGAGTRATATGM